MVTSPEDALRALAKALLAANVPYVVGGSVASSRYGEVRTTNDVDVVLDIAPANSASFLRAVEQDFLVNEVAVRDAIRRQSSFQAFHGASMVKFDFFIAGTDARSIRQIQNARPLNLENIDVFISSPEDIVLSKLVWYEMSNGVLERQLRDVVGVLKVSGASMNIAELREWAERLGVAKLLRVVLEDAGIPVD